MALREVVAPSSMDQILFVSLLWAAVNIALSVVFESPLFRWEVLIGTVVLGVWVVWAVQYRLEQFTHARRKRNR